LLGEEKEKEMCCWGSKKCLSQGRGKGGEFEHFFVKKNPTKKKERGSFVKRKGNRLGLLSPPQSKGSPLKVGHCFGIGKEKDGVWNGGGR